MDYVDECVISRFTGEFDEMGEEISTELYSGSCLFQIGASGVLRFDGYQFEQEALLFIPTNQVVIKTNDSISITTQLGSSYRYTAKFAEALQDSEFSELNDTCIWLKDGIQD